MALKPENPVVGGTVLRRQAIESPNYSPGVAGWTIKQDGSAEFNNLTIRGTFFGLDFIIASTGAFFYSGTPALGNLALSFVPGASTVIDPEGNTAQPGAVSYSGSGGFTQILGSLLNFFFGSGIAGSIFTGAAGNLTLNSGDVAADSETQLQLLSATASGSGNSTFNVIAQLAILTGNLTVQGTTITASGVTAVDLHQATVDVHNGNVNLNMASPPNYPTAGKTLAQTQACLDGLIGSMINRQLVA